MTPFIPFDHSFHVMYLMQDLQKAGAIAPQLLSAFLAYGADDTDPGRTTFLAATDDNAINVSSLDLEVRVSSPPLHVELCRDVPLHRSAAVTYRKYSPF